MDSSKNNLGLHCEKSKYSLVCCAHFYFYIFL